ncbi:ubiquitin-protein ligase peroxin 10 [Saccharomycopsis crataegensis]|uniref:RING-type E3 ubiquitin transferase n=1 Tax=Saccharomycopsis crataegensis TaxID=43959 RepID=A0AAV5QND5_9ASCO|nr:ubiquitin-protein ligase peroxin 10 [Saccharomycopsis crataegensis]
MPETQKDLVLPFADASAIVRSHQKDSYYESYLARMLSECAAALRGTRFAIANNNSFEMLSKLVYLALTTVMAKRTLGEEYVDLVYVSSDGKRLAPTSQKAWFAMSYAIIPFMISKLLSKIKATKEQMEYDYDDDDDDDTNNDSQENTSWSQRAVTKLVPWYQWLRKLNTLMEINLAIFYLFGSYYNLSKRITGLRYAFGHAIPENQPSNNKMITGYKVLGSLMLVKTALSYASSITCYLNEKLVNSAANSQDVGKLAGTVEDSGLIHDVASALHGPNTTIDLSNEKKLPYLKGRSRSCMLCLLNMVNPTSLPCGHCCCWNCIIDWCKDHNECPLCRAKIDNQFIPLR